MGLAENGVNDMYGWSGQKIAACPKTEGARCRCSGPGSAETLGEVDKNERGK